MAVKEVIWSKDAISSLEKIAWYVERKFGKKHADELVRKVRDSVLLISRAPNMYPITNENGIRKAVITPNTKLFFSVGKEIRIVYVGDSRNQKKNSRFQ